MSYDKLIRREVCHKSVLMLVKYCVSGYDIKQSDGEASALENWGFWSTPSLLLLPGLFWPGVVAFDRVLAMGQIVSFDARQISCVWIGH